MIIGSQLPNRMVLVEGCDWDLDVKVWGQRQNGFKHESRVKHPALLKFCDRRRFYLCNNVPFDSLNVLNVALEDGP